MEADGPAKIAHGGGSSRETTPESETASDSEIIDHVRSHAALVGQTSAPQTECAPKKPRSSLPPTRGLPFAQKADENLGKSEAEGVLGSGEETASEDDEL